VDVSQHVIDLKDTLIEQYAAHDTSKQAHAEYVDTLMQYTTAIVKASTEAVCNLLGVDMENVQMLTLTESQYNRLVESGMLDDYIEGKDTLDD